MMKSFTKSSRQLVTILLGLLLMLGSACTTEPPAGEPLDLEAINRFKPFRLLSLEGETITLDDVLDKVTLVAFFFPT